MRWASCTWHTESGIPHRGDTEFAHTNPVTQPGSEIPAIVDLRHGI